MSLEKGVFTLSIDFEFAWGYADHELSPGQKELIRKEVEITRRILALLNKYDIPATWAIVGHLIESDCAWENGRPHSDWIRPIVKNETRDWFWQHPAKDERDGLWYDSENLVSEIKSAKTGHEIGSHSYAHLLFDDNTSIEALRSDLASARRIHEKNRLDFRSFIYPRNFIGHRELLKEFGLVCYRDNYKKWYKILPRPLDRLGHIIDYFLPGVHTAKPRSDGTGLVAIDDSVLLIGRNGLRSLIPAQALVNKARRGIEQAANRQEVFQLWFHPSNFSYDTDRQFDIFETILSTAAEKQRFGDIEIMTLSQIAEQIL